MEKLKEKYEILFGFITIIISFAAFKDELKLIDLNLNQFSFNLYQLFIVFIVGFLISIYLYTIESVLSKTRLGNWRGFNYVILIAYTIFVLILLSPLLILVIYFLKLIISLLGILDDNKSKIISWIIVTILFGFSGYLGGKIAEKILKLKKDKAIEELHEEEIKELEIAKKLFSEGFYSQSILEAFKVLEIHLYKLISSQNHRVRRFNFQDLINGVIKLEIINKSEIDAIKELREIRNNIAHTDINISKIQAEKAFNLIDKIIKKSAANTVQIL